MKLSASLQDIIKIIDEIIELLGIADEVNWLNTLSSFKERCKLPQREEQLKLLSDIIRIYGGMGSFSDFVLYKNGNLMIDENIRLDDLRTKLYDLVINSRTKL